MADIKLGIKEFLKSAPYFIALGTVTTLFFVLFCLIIVLGGSLLLEAVLGK